jgi:hypothetical protein
MSNFKPFKACDVSWEHLKFPCWAMPKIEGVSWHRFQGVSFKEPHDSFGKLLYSLIYDKENL